ncbi:NAC domain-containing protein 53-like [Chenopodium quinoa]|uniref:NAC domain-containing protein 53-like n=1 Tax=Chenopodium quinoa TaxID=63459 RepID=UPI000B79AD91|nr:NAC domain-containing protein 53-like [Chenopodium quinoa]
MASSSNETVNFWNMIPPGFRFDPKDEELITHYLVPKINGKALPPNKMHETILYVYYEPESERTWYFFTRLERLYENGSRPRRSAGNGYWKATGVDATIRNKRLDGWVLCKVYRLARDVEVGALNPGHQEEQHLHQQEEQHQAIEQHVGLYNGEIIITSLFQRSRIVLNINNAIKICRNFYQMSWSFYATFIHVEIQNEKYLYVYMYDYCVQLWSCG